MADKSILLLAFQRIIYKVLFAKFIDYLGSTQQTFLVLIVSRLCVLNCLFHYIQEISFYLFIVANFWICPCDLGKELVLFLDISDSVNLPMLRDWMHVYEWKVEVNTTCCRLAITIFVHCLIYILGYITSWMKNLPYYG